MTSLPTWAIYVVSFGTPIAAFVGVLVGNLLTRKGARELETWRRREETMRMLRWASDLAVAAERAKARAGVAALTALSSSPLLQAEDQTLLDAMLDAVLEDPVEDIDEAGEDVEVVEVDTAGEDWDIERVEGRRRDAAEEAIE